MPIYEYECRGCGHRTEAMQRFSDPPLTTCSDCGGELRRLISAPAFQFKGSGWYVTDYARKGEKPKEKEEGKEKGAEAAEGKKEKKESGGSEKKEAKSSAAESAGS